MTQEQVQKEKKKRKNLDKVKFDELEDVHIGFEEALDNKDKSDKSAFVWFDRAVKAEVDTIRKDGESKGKSDEEIKKDLRKVCSIIWHKHNLRHKRTIQRYFDHVDENGNRPYIEYKGQHTDDELKRKATPVTLSAKDVSIKEGMESDMDSKADDASIFLENLLGDNISEYGTDNLYRVADLTHRVTKHFENEFKKKGIKYLNPYDSKRSDNIFGDDKDKKPVSTGVPALPKDEAIRKLMSIEEGKFDELIDLIVRLKERTKQYPPDDLEIHRNLVKGIESLIQFITPYIKKTWHASLPQWIEILTEQYNMDLVRLVNIDYKKLAKQRNVQSKHYSQDEILKGLSIEKHRNGLHPLQDLHDYVDDTGKLERLKLTDEQIDALKALDVMRFISRTPPFFVALDEYFRANQQGYRRKTKNDAHDRRSNNA